MRSVDKQLITTFLVHTYGVIGSEITWPDEVPGARNGEIDAITKHQRGTIALEHTSVDVLPDQRHQRHIITTYYNPPFRELSERARRWSKHVRLSLPDVLAKTGVDWSAAAKQIAQTIETIWPSLKATVFGQMQDITLKISGKEYKAITLCYEAKGRGTFLVSWSYDPEHASDFGDRVRKTVTDNIDKLSKYSENRTVLLIENNDVSLFSEQMLLEALKDYEYPKWFSELWYIDTSLSADLLVMSVYPRAGGPKQLVPEVAN